MLNSLFDVVFPQQSCCICREPGKYGTHKPWCEDCAVNIARLQNSGNICERCGKYLEEGKALCVDCTLRNPPFAIARAVGPYEDQLRIATKVLKFMCRKYLAPKMGSMMAEIVKSEPGFGHLDLIVPVPIAPNSFRTRGFNQTDLLARQISKDLRIRLDNTVIVRVKDTPEQKDLSREERERNLLCAFEIRGADKIRDKDILLVDDVYTTGSTVCECVRVLRDAGARRVCVMIWATGRGF